MTKRNIKKLIKEMIEDIDVDEIQVLFDTTTMDYCIRRMKECVLTDDFDKILLFLALYRIHQKDVEPVC